MKKEDEDWKKKERVEKVETVGKIRKRVC